MHVILVLWIFSIGMLFYLCAYEVHIYALIKVNYVLYEGLIIYKVK